MATLHGKWTRLLLLGVLLFLASPLAWSMNRSDKFILVVSSEDLTTPFLHNVLASFQAAVQAQLGAQTTISMENLDIARVDDTAYRVRLNEWLREKYRGQTVDIILAIGHSALKYLVEDKKQPWPATPIVFVTANVSTVQKMHLPSHVTGVLTDLSLSGVVDMAQATVPDLKQIALIGNALERDEYRPFSDAVLKSVATKIGIIDLRGKPFAEVKQRVASLPNDSAIYFTCLTEDGSGQAFISPNAFSELVKVANRPIFADNATLVGQGATGALASDPGERGRHAAGFVLRILGGQQAATLPPERETVHPIYDWHQLERWGIDPEQLPSGSELRFRPPNLLETYRWLIVATATVIALLILLVTALLVERHRRTIAVQEARQRLAEVAHMNRNATGSVYSAAIAHELNQPLAAIMSNAEAAESFLQMSPPPLAEIRDILADIRQDDRRAGELVQRMRGMLKKSDPEIHHIDLNAVVQDVTRFLGVEARMRGASLTISLTPWALMVAADLLQLQQVLVNLILNSLEAVADLPATKRDVTVLTTIRDVRYAEVVVADSGPGFGAYVEQAFDPFFTTKSQGMGLGLSITAAIIHSHGGRISAENAPKGGAVVRFQLPLVKPGSKA